MKLVTFKSINENQRIYLKTFILKNYSIEEIREVINKIEDPRINDFISLLENTSLEIKNIECYNLFFQIYIIIFLTSFFYIKTSIEKEYKNINKKIEVENAKGLINKLIPSLLV